MTQVINIDSQVEAKALDLVSQATVLPAIKTDNDLAVAGDIGKLLRDTLKVMTEHYKPIKQAMDASKKVVLDKEKADCLPVQTAISRLNGLSSDYLTEQERLRVIEQKKLDAAAALAADKEREKLLKAAVKAEDKGNADQAAELLEQAEEVYTEPVMAAAVSTVKTGVATIGGSKDVEVDVSDLKKFITELVSQDSRAFESLFKINAAPLKAWVKSNGIDSFPGLSIRKVMKSRVR